MLIQEHRFLNSLNFRMLDRHLDLDTESSSPLSDEFPLSGEPLKKDLWSFDYFWDEVVLQFSSVEQLYVAIQDIQKKIHEIKEAYRSKGIPLPDFTIQPNRDRGISGSYFLVDDEGKKHYIVKPLDEDGGCLNSPEFASPMTSGVIRNNIPNYQSVMREVLAYQIAQSIGVESIVPKTFMSIIQSDLFNDLSDMVDPSELKRYFEHCSPADKEKLCSVQEFVPNAKTLFEALQDLQQASLSDAEIAERFDQKDIEDANILLWTTYDTDGHSGNFLVYPKGTDAIGNEILGLKKIDNALSCPETNKHLVNSLANLPNAKFPLSEEGRAKILAIDVEKLAKQYEEMGLTDAIPALRERIPALKALAEKPGITLKEINKAMSKIGKKG